jgi:hypothetical protein
VSREIKAWAIEEKQGGRRGKLISLDATPSWYPVKTALYYTRNDAIKYIRNTQSESKYRVVRVQVTIEKLNDDQGIEDEREYSSDLS